MFKCVLVSYIYDFDSKKGEILHLWSDFFFRVLQLEKAFLGAFFNKYKTTRKLQIFTDSNLVTKGWVVLALPGLEVAKLILN